MLCFVEDLSMEVWFMDALFLFILHASIQEKAGFSVSVMVQVSIDQRFSAAKINESRLDNATLAIIKKYSEYVSTGLKGVGSEHRSINFYARDKQRKTFYATLTNELSSSSRMFPLLL